MKVGPVLVDWFCRCARDLPWRRSYDAYHVFVSEVMLQQTQMETVIPYYLRWMEVYPDLKSLAAASEAEALKLWEGLGYYSRCRNLLACARQLVETGYDTLPREPEVLLRYPGIGPYTAGAIASIAYDVPVPAVDGNAERVTARLFDLDFPFGGTQLRKKAGELLEEQMEGVSPRLFNQAVMELGAVVCTPVAVRCSDCPLISFCLSLKRGTLPQRPVPRVRPRTEKVEAIGLLLVAGDRLVLRKRPEGGLWSGFWEVPWMPVEGESSVCQAEEWILREFGVRSQVALTGQRVTFSFTKYRVSALVARCTLPVSVCLAGRWASFLRDGIGQLTLSAGSRKFLKGGWEAGS